jgi:hypothetical protein
MLAIQGDCAFRSYGANICLLFRGTARFAPTELLIWFGDWNYKHFAPKERYNRIDR